ncbi:MAG: hypothetical protein ABSH06_01290 [Thermodesulfobacteriota bacterium]
MVKRVFLFLIILTAILTFISIAYSQMEKKTVKLPSGELVCDLKGEWNTLYEHYGPMQWVGNIKGMMMIIQQGNTFVGKTTTDSGWTPKGTEKIRGELDKDGIKKVRYSRPDIGWTDAKGEMSKNCDKIVFDDGNGVKVILERK